MFSFITFHSSTHLIEPSSTQIILVIITRIIKGLDALSWASAEVALAGLGGIQGWGGVGLGAAT
jgi:hypothetical protein